MALSLSVLATVTHVVEGSGATPISKLDELCCNAQAEQDLVPVGDPKEDILCKAVWKTLSPKEQADLETLDDKCTRARQKNDWDTLASIYEKIDQKEREIRGKRRKFTDALENAVPIPGESPCVFLTWEIIKMGLPNFPGMKKAGVPTRLPRVKAAMLASATDLELDYKSVSDQIKQQYLQCKVSKNADDKWVADNATAQRSWKITPNKYPHTLASDLEQLVFWSLNEMEIKEIKEEVIQHLGRGKPDDYLVWENAPQNRSVLGLTHYHVIFKKPT